MFVAIFAQEATEETEPLGQEWKSRFGLRLGLCLSSDCLSRNLSRRVAKSAVPPLLATWPPKAPSHWPQKGTKIFRGDVKVRGPIGPREISACPWIFVPFCGHPDCPASPSEFPLLPAEFPPGYFPAHRVLGLL